MQCAGSTKKPPNQMETNTPPPTTTIPATNDGDDKKKKQERERNLGGDVEQGVRVELVVRGHVGETQGETQTPKGFGFPQHLRQRERERKRKNGADEHTKHKRKREGTTNIWAYRGQVLKGTKANSIPTPETKPQTKNQNHPRTT